MFFDMSWGTLKGTFVSSKVFGIEKKGVWGKGNIPMTPLNNFSDFFWKKNNNNFCNYKEDYTFKFLKQFEKKIP